MWGCMREELSYLLLGTEPDMRVRMAGIGGLLLDTVTTLYVLFASGLPAQEQAPLGAVLLDGGQVGLVLFMAVPLFNLLLFLYVPGILGDAIAFSGCVLHVLAAVINLGVVAQVPVSAVLGVPFDVIHIAIIAVSTVIGALAYLPALRRRHRSYHG